MKSQLLPFNNNLFFIDDLKVLINQLELSNKNILFIEPYGASLSLFMRGVESGYNIIVLTANSDLRVVPEHILLSAAIAIKIDTANEEMICDLIHSMKNLITFDAVIPGFEYFVPIASKISNMLSIPGIDPDNVLNLRRKDYMRSILKRADITTPDYVLIDTIDDLDIVNKILDYPMVCKPVDAAGSVNVKRVNNRHELYEAAARILYGNDVLWGYRLSNILLIEEYVEGKEYSLEGIVQRGQIHHFSVTEKFVSDQTDFVEIGHIVNPPIDSELKQKMQSYVDKIINLLGADYCPFHAEIRIDKHGNPVLMEIAARLAGDKIGELINLSTKVNYYDYVYSAYLGEDCQIEDMADHVAGIRFFYRPNVGQFSTINDQVFDNREKVNNIVFYYQPGEKIPSFPKPLRRLGHVMVSGDQYHEVVKILDDIDRHIQFSA